MIAALLATAAAALPGWPPAHRRARPRQPARRRQRTSTPCRRATATSTSRAASTPASGGRRGTPTARSSRNYVSESRAVGRTPVLTYYQLLQSGPGAAPPARPTRTCANLADPALMRAYYDDLALALTRARAAARGRLGRPARRARPVGLRAAARPTATTPRTVPAGRRRHRRPAPGRRCPTPPPASPRPSCACATQLAPGGRAGLAHEHLGHRRRPRPAEPVAAGRRPPRRALGAKFYASLHAPFDAIFSDPSDRDDGFGAKINGDHGQQPLDRAATTRATSAGWPACTARRDLPLASGRSRWATGGCPNTWRPLPRHARRDAAGRTGACCRALPRRRGRGALLFGGGAAARRASGPTAACSAASRGRYARAMLRTQPSR